MSKADNISLSGTTKRKIGKKTIPESPKEKETPTPKKVETKKELSKTKMKKTNFQLSEEMHFKAKVTAMELGIPLREYITNLIMDDLKKRKKI